MIVLFFGCQMVSYVDGLILEDLIVKLCVDNFYQVEKGIGEFDGYLIYCFLFDGKQVIDLDEIGLLEVLQVINVVFNFYYGFLEYEDFQFENIVKIFNLLSECMVMIYLLDGKFICKYE